MRLILVASVLCLAPAVHAQSTLSRASSALEELELELAGKLFQKALQAPATREERIAAYRGLGLALAFQGKTQGAVEAFEKLLLIDPEASVDLSLGPKVAGPFEQAQKGLAGKKNELTLRRERTGELLIELHEDVPLAKEFTVNARTGESGAFNPLTAAAGAPVSMGFEESEDVEAFAEALDANEGVLYVAGTRQKPLLLPAPVPKIEVAAVTASKKVEPTLEKSSSLGSSWWPIIVGAGVMVGAGIAAAAVVSQPPPLKLPPADRTSGLP